jgi:hypothetical protein
MAAVSLENYVKEWARLAQATPVVLARRTPSFILAISIAMPVDLRGDGGSIPSYIQDFQDAFVVASGRSSEVANIFARRVFERLSDFPALNVLAPFFAS